MHAVRAGSTRDIGSIVDEQSCVAATRNRSGALRELVKRPPRQSLFTNLKERNLRRYGSFNELKDLLDGRRAARYRIDDRQWKFERHFLASQSGLATP